MGNDSRIGSLNLLSPSFFFIEFTVPCQKNERSCIYQLKLENTKGQSKMDSLEKLATRRRQAMHKHNTSCVGQTNVQEKTNNINKIYTLLQTT